jgi:hypothetical protein
MLTKDNVSIYKETPKYITVFHNHLVKNSKDEDKSRPKSKPEKDGIVVAVDGTGIKVNNQGEWTPDKWKN